MNVSIDVTSDEPKAIIEKLPAALTQALTLKDEQKEQLRLDAERVLEETKMLQVTQTALARRSVVGLMAV